MDSKQFMDRLYERAGRAGFDAFELSYTAADRFEVSVYEGEVDEYAVSATAGVSLRALVNGRMGFASTEALDEDAIELLVHAVARNAAVIESDDEQFIFAGSPEYARLQAYDEPLQAVTPQQKIELARTIEREARAASPLVTNIQGCMFYTSSGNSMLRNSRGLDLSFTQNGFMSYVSPVVQRDGETKTADAMRFGRTLEGFDPQELAKEAVDTALLRLGAAPLPSGTYAVAFDNQMTGELFRAFSGIFSAENAQKGRSRLAGREGEAIAAPLLTITDEPHLPRSLTSTPFDGEGVATARRNIVQDGRLLTLLHNLKTAAKAGCASTGNSTRGGQAVSFTNMVIQPGALSRDELLRTMGTGLIVTDMAGLHSGLNPISGDFSVSVQGYHVVGGERAGSVDQITIAGNFYTLLHNITALANDCRSAYPQSFTPIAPTMLVQGLRVAGK